MSLILDGKSLTVDDVLSVAQEGRQVSLSESCIPRIQKARQTIEAVLARGEVVYGANTGFGYLKNQVIPSDKIHTLQHNLLLSHAVGVGAAFSEEHVRAMLLLRINTLTQGHSGIRLAVIERMIDFLNAKVHPFVPSKGSVGASGDLAPLSHLALPLIGEGAVFYQGQKQSSAKVLRELGWEPLELEAKEGLALINGTQPMSAVACCVSNGLNTLLDLADWIAAANIQAGLGSYQPFRPELHALRPHPGQLKSADHLYRWMQNSEMVEHHSDCEQVQDAYSYRCTPQVHGASRDSAAHIQKVLECEINAVTDNPLVLPETGEVISCGHFHGQPVALVMEQAAVALAELANISERRIERLLNPDLNRGLPAFLSPDGGLNSGYMIAQYAAAALVSENKVLAHPAAVDSIPTSANQEDHVSMGTISARKAFSILENTQTVLAIELLCTVQALDLRAPLCASEAVETLRKLLRKQVPKLEHDRYLHPEIERVAELIREGYFCLPPDSSE